MESVIVELTSQKRLLNDVFAASFGGFGTGVMLGGKAGCGRMSLFSMTVISVWINLVVCGL